MMMTNNLNLWRSVLDNKKYFIPLLVASFYKVFLIGFLSIIGEEHVAEFL